LFVSVRDAAGGSTNPLRFTVSGGCDFSFRTVTPATQTVRPGSSATYQIILNTVGSNGAPVQLSCPDAPAGVTCAAPIIRIKPPEMHSALCIAAGSNFTLLDAIFLMFQIQLNA
jgi:hypothetical protein